MEKINQERLNKIEEWTETAICIFKFLQGLPSPLGEFIFKKIVDDAYEMANVVSEDSAKSQLVEAICNSVEISQNIDPVYDYLDVKLYKDEIDPILTDRKESYAHLIRHTRFETFPNKLALIKAYNCFSPTCADEDYAKNLKPRLSLKLQSLPEQIENTCYDLPSNIFQGIGYKTLFIRWVCCPLDDFEDFNGLLFDWYCKGSILNMVFDTVFKCNVSMISKSLMQYIQNECKDNYYLSKAFQDAYNSYRIYTSLPEMLFVCDTTCKPKSSQLKRALPCIKDSSGEDVSEECLYKLYDSLKGREIKCEFEEFKAVFSGQGYLAKPIKWFVDQYKLASFLVVAQGKKETHKEYAKWAEEVFLKENGDPTKWKTLNQPDWDVIKIYETMFNNAEISR